MSTQDQIGAGAAPEPVPSFQPYANFEDAGEAILDYLHDQLGLDLWMITRTVGDDWIVLLARDEGYGIAAGEVLPWSDTFCYRMTKGDGPMVAPDAMAVPAYASAPAAKSMKVGAYVGVPLAGSDGEFFGTLCGIDPEPQTVDSGEAVPHLELAARILATLLKLERERDRNAAAAEAALEAAEVDPLTGVGNRRAWDRALESEESRAARYGDPAAVIILDLDGLKVVNDSHGHAAGDELLRRTAKLLRSTTRDSDVVARLGGDEFGILAKSTGEGDATALVDRVVNVFIDNSIEASIGMASRRPGEGLLRAWKVADEEMYAAKDAS